MVSCGLTCTALHPVEEAPAPSFLAGHLNQTQPIRFLPTLPWMGPHEGVLTAWSRCPGKTGLRRKSRLPPWGQRVKVWERVTHPCDSCLLGGRSTHLVGLLTSSWGSSRVGGSTHCLLPHLRSLWGTQWLRVSILRPGLKTEMTTLSCSPHPPPAGTTGQPGALLEPPPFLGELAPVSSNPTDGAGALLRWELPGVGGNTSSGQCSSDLAKVGIRRIKERAGSLARHRGHRTHSLSQVGMIRKGWLLVQDLLVMVLDPRPTCGFSFG